MGVALHRLQAESRRRVNEPLQQLEVRVGSATDALTPLSRATRSFAATPVQWLSLGAIVLAAVVGDQVTKHVVASNLSFGEGLHVVGPFSIRHVQNSGIAFGLFSNATAGVIVVTAIAVAWMLVYFARSGGRLRRFDRDLLPTRELVALSACLSVHEDRACLEQPRSRGSRAYIGQPREVAVEPLPSSLGRDDEPVQCLGECGSRSARSSAASRIPTPITMKLSARLNAGQ